MKKESSRKRSSRDGMLFTRQRSAVAALVLGVLTDVAVSLLCLGFYNARSCFDLDVLLRHLSIREFDFFHTLHDFALLVAVRSVFVFGGIVLRAFQKNDEKFNSRALVVFGLATISWSFLLVKILAISESPEQLGFAGLWLTVVWTVVASAWMVAVWLLVLPSTRIWPLSNASAQATAEYSPLITNDAESAAVSKETASKGGVAKHMWRLVCYCRHAIHWFLLGFVFLLIYALARVAIPKFTGEVIATIVSSKSKEEGMQRLVSAVLKMTGLVAVSSIFGGLRGGCFTYASMIVNCRMRCDLFRSLMRQEIAFYDQTKTGEITSRLTSDCQTMATTVATNLNVFMRNGVMLLGSLGFMFSMSWHLTLVTFIAVPLVGFITKVYGAYYDDLSERTQKALADANHVAEQTLSTMRTVRSFACEDKETERFEGFVGETIHINKKKSVAYMFYTWLNEGCDNAILVGVLFYGGHLVLTEKMTADNLIAFLLYQMQLGENLYNLGYVFTGLMEAVGASRKVFDYMLREPKVANDGTLKPEVEGNIEFAEVTFAYPSRLNRKVLDGISFNVNAGETVALVGPSGGGKSTCVALLEHFYNLLGGAIRLDGVDISLIEHHFFHEKIALVAQEPVLYEGTVGENILYGFYGGSAEERQRLMEAAAKKANVHDFVMQMEKGYETNCGERGVQMSGGQKQRIAIARALVRNPAVLILDEATSALDTESEHIVQEAISEWCKERKTVIVIAHRLSTVEKADKILVISGGKVIQCGRHSELIKERGKLYHKLVNRQLLGIGDADASEDSPLAPVEGVVDETEDSTSEDTGSNGQ
ncbi:hypothetical protein QR680_008962 [Steinernema hermaphroditum]|uniref:Uncharacterized protein n=1 Tax=Steinernema hermaphroditum TaxID=289476 RepID=A0AA39M8L2_9BILA|nr:hypothetical protein QR680_008962 [Steinernema hermaphroditum]